MIGYWGEAVATPAQARDLVTETGARGLAGDLFVDGALGSRTAWLHEPYADAPDCIGTCHLDVDGIEAHVRACTKAEVTAGFHVIGDAAVSAAVAAFERVVADLGVVAVARCGHRLEHVEMVTADQAAKLGAWGVIASVQPNFDELWGGGDGMYARRLGAQRGSELNPLALLASQGVPLALGSDAPVTGFDPWASVRAAVNHRTPAAGYRRGRRLLPRPAAAGGPVVFETAGSAPWCPARPRPTRYGTPGTLTSTHRATQSSAGLPTRAPGYPHCRGWARPTPCRVAAKPCIEVRSSMAREWFGRKARPAEVAEAGPESPADPEIELSAEPAEGPDAPSAAAWLGAAAAGAW